MCEGMDERQAVECIMKTLGLEGMMVGLEDASISSEVDMLTILSLAVSSGIRYERCRAEEIRQRKKEKNQKKERNNIYNNNNKEKENIVNLSLLNTGESSIAPLEAKRQAKKKVVRRVQMPKAWVDAREKETIDVEGLLVSYAQSQSYDWYAAKELFFAFVDYHLAKGSIFKSWDAAWRTWIRNDIKFNGKPATHKAGSMIQSYKTKSPIEGLFNDD
jgi:hypothetical protein